MHRTALEALIYTANLIGKIMADFWIKVTAGAGIAVLAFFFDKVNAEALTALLVLIVIDFITGIYSQYQIGAKIESRKALRSAIKTAVYFSLISAGYMTEKTLIDYLHIIDETIIAFLAVTELISILENIAKLGYAIPKKLLHKLEQYRDEK